MSTVRQFKKYANRKFYDVDRGEYVSVDDIAAVVKKGGDVVMTCDRTGRDLTMEILSRILYEEVRKAGKSGKVPARPTSGEIAKLVRFF